MEQQSPHLKKNIQRLQAFLATKKRTRCPWILVTGDSGLLVKKTLQAHYPNTHKVMLAEPIQLMSSPHHTWIFVKESLITLDLIKIFQDQIKDVIYTSTQHHEKKIQLAQLQSLFKTLSIAGLTPRIRIIFTDASQVSGLTELSQSLSTHELPYGFGLRCQTTSSSDYPAILQSYDQFIQRIKHCTQSRCPNSHDTRKALELELFEMRHILDRYLSIEDKSQLSSIHWVQLPIPNNKTQLHLSLEPILTQLAPETAPKKKTFNNPWLIIITLLIAFNGFLSIKLLSKNTPPPPLEAATILNTSQRLDEWLPQAINYMTTLKSQAHWYESGQKKRNAQKITDNKKFLFLNKNIIPQVIKWAIDDLNHQEKTPLDQWNAFLFINYLLYQSTDDPSTIAAWINQHFNRASKEDRQNLKTILTSYHKHMGSRQTIDAIQVDLIRNGLKKINFTQVSFLRINRQFKGQTTPIKSFSKLYHFNRKITPTIFTSRQLQQIFSQDIPREIALMRSQVESIKPFNLTPPSIADMRESLGNLYLKSYDGYWNEYINSIKIQPNQLGLALEDLTKGNGEWKSIESSVYQQACQLPQTLKSQLDICQHLGHYEAIKNKSFNQWLIQYRQSYQKIINRPDVPKAAFNTTSNIMSDEDILKKVTQAFNSTSNLPEPYKSMVQHGLAESWQHLLFESLLHINTIWEASVYKEYKHTISQTFPINSSRLDLSIDQFDHFFSPNGTLNSFFSFYIQPYVMIEHGRWVLKKTLGGALPINPSALDAWNDAGIIQNIFYPNNQNSASLDFQLIPVKYSSETGSIKLSLFKQPLSISATHMPSLNFSWSKKTAGAISTQPTNKKAKQVIYPGPWSWLRWLQSCQAQTGHLIHLKLNIDNQQILFLMNLPVSLTDLQSLHSFTMPKTLTYGENFHAITSSKANPSRG